jgi:hypothetical protein
LLWSTVCVKEKLKTLLFDIPLVLRVWEASWYCGELVLDCHCDRLGADALRLYEMFMGPLEATKPWQTSQLAGTVSAFILMMTWVISYL